jgi:hypothetical protein
MQFKIPIASIMGGVYFLDGVINVKKTVKRGTGGVPIAPIRGTRGTSATKNMLLVSSSEAQEWSKTELQQHETAVTTTLLVLPDKSDTSVPLSSSFISSENVRDPKKRTTNNVIINFQFNSTEASRFAFDSESSCASCTT